MSYAHAAGLLSPRTYTLTLLQASDIVCSVLTVNYHNNNNNNNNDDDDDDDDDNNTLNHERGNRQL